MAQIIQTHPADNPRLNEIYEILLVAGYFRIRIASLQPFDKVLGGLAWCITSSNFEIDVEYHDEMQIGEKIRASELICDALVQMKCPHSLQPFQLQGLDVNSIFPITQWLIKFVYETRWERQKYDRELSLMLGRPITRIENRGNPERIFTVPIQRKRINRTIDQVSFHNPVRVYSALLEYQDATATKMYNKLLNIITKKSKSNNPKSKSKSNSNSNNPKSNSNSKAQEENFVDILLSEEKQQQQADKKDGRETLQRDMNEFGNVSSTAKFSVQKIEHIILENKEQLENGVRQVIESESQHSVLFASSDRAVDSSQALPGSGTTKDLRNQEQRILKQAKSQNSKYVQKIQILENQIQSFCMIEDQLDSEIQVLMQKYAESKEAAEREIERTGEYRALCEDLEEQIGQRKEKMDKKLERLVDRRQELKENKMQLKKRMKAKIEELTQETEIAEASVPEIDEEAFKEMLGEAQLKKEVYDKKYEELTLVNKDLAVLQRKAENYTSPPEIAQYHQRFVELFEGINVLIEEKRSLYSETTNLESLKSVVRNYIEIINNIKEAYVDVKKRQELKELTENARQYLEGLEKNMLSSENTLAKVRATRQSTYANYMDLIKMERDYLHLLRSLKLEYENAAKQCN